MTKNKLFSLTQLESRKINDSMPSRVVDQVEEALRGLGKSLKNSKVLVLGTTFKENVSDLRNSKSAEMCQILSIKAHTLDIIDPTASQEEMLRYYGLHLSEVIDDGYDAIIYAVNHKEFDHITWNLINSIKSENAVVFD